MADRVGSTARGVLSYFTRHGTAANLLMVLLLLAGLYAYPQMRTQFFPDVVVDRVNVSVSWPGAGAEDVDAGIVQVLEPALLAVEGVTQSSARARQGSASISLEFEPGWDMARAAEDVAAAADAAGPLPEDAEEPEVARSEWRDRVTDVVITGPVAPEQLARFADDYVAELFSRGVTRATIRGIAAPSVVVEVPLLSLIEHRLTMAEIASAIAAATAADPAGEVGGVARLRTGTERRSPDEIAAVVLRAEPDGTALRVGDVATIRAEGVDSGRSYFVGDNPAMSVRVDRSARGDALDIQATVEEAAAAVAAELPAGVSIDLIRTRADAISGRLQILVDNGLIGLGLVLILLFLFLNARTAFWVAAGIPVAMCAALALMWLGGLTLNMISLFALIITLGIVVDDAIVVGEHADARYRALREDPFTAAENAARRMFLPVFSATLTTIIAFYALVLVSGRFGDLISAIPFTVIAVLAASLVECFLILPNHMAHALASSAKERWYDWPSRQVNRGFRRVREHLFRPFTRAVVALRYPVVAAAVLLLATQLAALVRGDVPWRFFNAPEQATITTNFAMVPGATREDSMEMMRELQRAVSAVAARYEAEHGADPVAYVLAEVGGNSGRSLAASESRTPDQLGAVTVELIDPDLRPYSSFAFLADLQEEIVNHPLAETVSSRGWRSGPDGDSLDVELSGADAETLKAAAEDLKSRLARFPEVSGLQDTLAYDTEELILELTAQGRALGFTTEGVGRVLRDRLSGVEAARFPEGPRTGTIRVELPAAERGADFLDRSFLQSPAGAFVPLSDIVTVETRGGFSTIRRENGVQVISVLGDISEDDPDRAAQITQTLAADILPEIEIAHGVSAALSGLAEEERQFLSDARTAFLLCVAGIYLVLAWIFASWSRPAVIMAVIPFGLVGAIWGHAVWDVPLSMFSVVGLLGMTGIIINDSIVLVTTVDEQARDKPLIQAIVDGTADRLRPVLLTTLTTVLGLAPLLFEGSVQAEFLKPTVITLVYGLGFGMVLVLVLVPALMAIGRDIGAILRWPFAQFRPAA